MVAMLGLVALPEKTIVRVTAGNYGGNLGPFHIRLHDVLDRYAGPA